MKTLIILLLSFSSFGQLEVKEPVKHTVLFKASTVLWLVKFEQDTTDVFYTLYYQNAKYKHIIDTKFLSFDDSLELNQFIDLCLRVIENKEEFETSKYTLKTFNKAVFIMNEDRSYFTLSKKYLLKLQLIKK